MAIQEITSPPMLDSTGQNVVTKLQGIATALSVNASGVDYDNTVSGLTADKVQSAIDEVKGITDTINQSLTQLIATDTFESGNVTVANNDRGVITVDITKQGYTPIGLGVVTFSNNYVFLGSFNLSGNSAIIVCHNRTGNAVTLYAVVKAIYVKN